MKIKTAFQLLRILSEETNEQHCFSVQELVCRMKERFHVVTDRRTVRKCLDELTEADFPLNYTEQTRRDANGNKTMIRTNWYMEPEFEASEIRLLVDLLHELPTLPESQRTALENKLMRFAAPELSTQWAEHPFIYQTRPAAKQLLYSADLLCEAIRRDCMVEFKYCSYIFDGEKPVLRPRTRADGSIRIYFVSPYQIAVSHGNYYLICCKEPHNTPSSYRIDRITDLKIIENYHRKPIEELLDCLPPAESLYMYQGERVFCEFTVSEGTLDAVIDWFGSSAVIGRLDDSTLLVKTEVHPDAMLHWALQYGDAVTVISPDFLRQKIADAIRKMCHAYHV